MYARRYGPAVEKWLRGTPLIPGVGPSFLADRGRWGGGLSAAQQEARTPYMLDFSRPNHDSQYVSLI